MRNANSESASIRMREKATFTMMALVENNTAPVNANKNPAMEMVLPGGCFML